MPVKRSTRKSKKRSRRISTAGNILSHLDVTTKNDIPALMKRITKGPVTVILVYADWCGHCNTYKPEFNKLAKSPERTTQIVSINEKVLSPVNEMFKKNNSNAGSLNPDGYPTVFIANKDASLISPIKRDSVGEVMKRAGPLAEESISKPLEIESLEPLEPSEPSLKPSPMNEMPAFAPTPTFAPIAPMKPKKDNYKPAINPLDKNPFNKNRFDKNPFDVSAHTGGSLYRKMAESMKSLKHHFTSDILTRKHNKRHK